MVTTSSWCFHVLINACTIKPCSGGFYNGLLWYAEDQRVLLHGFCQYLMYRSKGGVSVSKSILSVHLRRLKTAQFEHSYFICIKATSRSVCLVRASLRYMKFREPLPTNLPFFLHENGLPLSSETLIRKIANLLGDRSQQKLLNFP